jgi:hypothetical protein
MFCIHLRSLNVRLFNGSSYWIKAAFNGMTSMLNLMKMYHMVQKLLVGGGQRQQSHKTRFPSFKERRLNTI